MSLSDQQIDSLVEQWLQKEERICRDTFVYRRPVTARRLDSSCHNHIFRDENGGIDDSRFLRALQEIQAIEPSFTGDDLQDWHVRGSYPEILD